MRKKFFDGGGYKPLRLPFFRLAALLTLLALIVSTSLSSYSTRAQALPKLSGALQRLISERNQPNGQAAAQAYAQTQGIEIQGTDERLVVVAEGAGDLASALQQQGGRLQTKYKSLWQVDIPLHNVERLAQAAPVSFVRLPQVASVATPIRLPAPAAVLTTFAQSRRITSEGVALIGADQLHAQGITGQGVKVAIIDLGFAGADQIVGLGELPASLTMWNCRAGPCRKVNPVELSDASGGESHGAAVAEIVHDVAPDAELHLFLIKTEVELGQATEQAIDAGIQVINHSVGWFNDNNFYQGQGRIGNFARTARQTGVFWVNAAGNFAQLHYEATFQDRNGDRLHDEVLEATLEEPRSIQAYLTWDDWSQALEDFDFELWKGGKQLAASLNPVDGHLLDERLSYPATEAGTYQLKIRWAGEGPAPINRRLELFVFPGLQLKPFTSPSSLPEPVNAVEAFAVGAIAERDWAVEKLEPFSSWGPTNAGKDKPDLLAPDCVSTVTSMGLVGGAIASSASICGSNGRFPGTSAAAPHVVGMAALLLSQNAGMDPDELEQALKERAVPLPQLTVQQAGAGKLSALALPDLVLENVTIAPNEVQAGESVQVRATVKNVGAGDAGPFWVSLWRKGEEGRAERELATQRFSQGLRAEATASLALTWDLPQDEPGGVRSLTLELDPFGDVHEKSEGNNRKELTVQVRAMVLIPAGSFQMGDSFGEGGSDELPVHTVTVSAFYMDKYEVTKGLWDEVASWASANGYDISVASGDGKAGNHPVYNVTWYEAVKWANARSEKAGLVPCYYTDSSQVMVYRTGNVDVPSEGVKWSGCGYRLPTEAEWEKAARGGAAGKRFPWSDTDTIQHSRANYYSCTSELLPCNGTSYSYDTSPTRRHHPDYDNDPQPYTSPVGSFASNGYGLYDMAGNVWEWAWDWYGLSYYASSPGSDPRGPASSSYRVLRGGSWINNASVIRVADRNVLSPGYEVGYFGFRLGPVNTIANFRRSRRSG